MCVHVYVYICVHTRIYTRCSHWHIQGNTELVMISSLWECWVCVNVYVHIYIYTHIYTQCSHGHVRGDTKLVIISSSWEFEGSGCIYTYMYIKIHVRILYAVLERSLQQHTLVVATTHIGRCNNTHWLLQQHTSDVRDDSKFVITSSPLEYEVCACIWSYIYQVYRSLRVYIRTAHGRPWALVDPMCNT